MASIDEYDGKGDYVTFVLNAVGAFYVDLIRKSLEFYELKGSRLYTDLAYRVDARKGELDITLPDYAEWVEQGRRPFGNESQFVVNTLPPMGAILDWIKRKRIRGRDKRGRFISANKLAWAIRVMIGKRGIKPRPFLERAQSQAGTQIEEYFATSFSLLVSEALRDRINKILR